MQTSTLVSLQLWVARCNLAAAAAGAVALVGVALAVSNSSYLSVASILLGLGGAGLLTALSMRATPAATISDYQSAVAELSALQECRSSKAISSGLEALSTRHQGILLIEEQIEQHRPAILSWLKVVRSREEAERDAQTVAWRRAKLAEVFAEARQEIRCRADRRRDMSAPFVARRRLDEAIVTLTETGDQVRKAWQENETKMSWWQRLTVDPPDLSELDKKLAKLKAARASLDQTGELERVQSFLGEAVQRGVRRLDALEGPTLHAAPASHKISFDEPSFARAALWLSVMSVPVSAWGDLARGGDVYDALRRANGQMAEMSDAEIWLHALALPAESLAGLTSLAKGAYFEQIVANATGGELYADFNHPGTDIVIDGVAYQIKATDSEAYLATVPKDIPIIATSEVADASGTLDVGIPHADVERATELALGGSIVDVGDTAADALLTGVGGLGVLATLRGINHTANRIKTGHDAELAVLEGAGVAITGTAKAVVDSAELGYKVLTSRPSRFVGRQIVKLGSRIGNAMDPQDQSVDASPAGLAKSPSKAPRR